MAIRKLDATLVFKGEGENGEPEYGNRIAFAVNSADEKPSGALTNGSACIEVDTGKVFLWDEEQNYWIEQFSLQGGGNPNSVQVITGTLANPFGDVDLTELLDALYVGADQTGNAHAVIDCDASMLGFGHIVQPLIGLNGVFSASSADVSADTSLCNELTWSSSTGDFIDVMMEQNGTITNLSEYASLVPTTLTIYWHPMS